jgi:hypothetical protein
VQDGLVALVQDDHIGEVETLARTQGRRLAPQHEERLRQPGTDRLGHGAHAWQGDVDAVPQHRIGGLADDLFRGHGGIHVGQDADLVAGRREHRADDREAEARHAHEGAEVGKLGLQVDQDDAFN